MGDATGAVFGLSQLDDGRLLIDAPTKPHGVRGDAEWRRTQHRRATATAAGVFGRPHHTQNHWGVHGPAAVEAPQAPATARGAHHFERESGRRMVRPLKPSKMEAMARSTWHSQERALIRASSLDTHGQFRGTSVESNGSHHSSKRRFSRGPSFPKGTTSASHWHPGMHNAENLKDPERDWDGVLPRLQHSRESSLAPGAVGPPGAAGLELPAVEPVEPNFIALAQTLVERRGSLARAFAYFDPQHTGKVTRTRWDSALSTLHIDLQELCGAASKQVFKMVDGVHGRGKGDVQLEEWNYFWKKHLEGTEAEHLLLEDRGDPRPERRHSRRHSKGSVPAVRRSESAAPGEGAPGSENAPLQVDGTRADSKQRAGSKTRAGSKQRAGSKHSADSATRATEAVSTVSSGESTQRDTQAVSEGTGPAQNTARTDQEGKAEHGGPGPVLLREVTEAPEADELLEAPGRHHSDPVEDAVRSTAQGSEVQDAQPRTQPRVAEEVEEQPARSESLESSGSRGDGEGSEALRWAKKNAIVEQMPPSEGISLELPRILSGEKSYDEVELGDHDFHAIALHEELHQDLKHLELEGIQALGYIFIAKFGSLKLAFKWFDTNKQGRFGQVAWDNGLKLLRTDVERLTGFNEAQIFHMMDQEPTGGSVSLKKWNRFFAAVEEGALATHLLRTAKEKGSITERALDKSAELKKTHKEHRKDGTPRREHSGKPGRKNSIRGLRKDASQQSITRGGSRRPKKVASLASASSVQLSTDGSIHLSPEQEAAQEEQRLKQEDAFRQKALEELEVLVRGDAMTYLNGQFTKWHPSSPDQPTAPTSPTNPEQRKMKAEAEFDALSAEEKCEIVEEIADELGLWRLPRADAKANYGRSATMAFLKPSVVGSAVLVCHLRLFAEATSTQLSKLQGTHGSLEFPSSLSEIQRVVIHVLAASKGLTTLSEGSGADRRLVAYDTGDFALDMRTNLVGIKSGESKVITDVSSSAQRRLVHTIAMEMGLDVASKGTSRYEVFNLKDFRDEMEEELQGLQDGQVHELPATLSEQERQVVHEMAMHLGLTAHTEGGRTTRVVTVANLKNFIATSREKMKAITGPLVEQFGPSLTQMQLVALEATASELGLRSARRHTIEGPSMLVSLQEIPEEEERRPSVTKPEEKESSATDEAAAPAEAPENRETSQASLIERVFEAYATGHYRGQRTFLRFSDLKDFAEDIKELMPDVHKSFHHFTGLLEFYYDDTQQLQSDMGLHGAKGLTLRYFQVFVQKVLRRLGPQIVGVLFALIDR